MPTECSGDPLTTAAATTPGCRPAIYAESQRPPASGRRLQRSQLRTDDRSAPHHQPCRRAPRASNSTSTSPRTKIPKASPRRSSRKPSSRCRPGSASTPPPPTACRAAPKPRPTSTSKHPRTAPMPPSSAKPKSTRSLLHEPLKGSLFLATPHQNPFGSLLAGYIVRRRPGHQRSSSPGNSKPTPQTGQITASFPENPQLPFEDLKLALFGGALGALRTPTDLRRPRSPVCHHLRTDPFLRPRIGSPGDPDRRLRNHRPPRNGSPCPSSAAQEPNAPRFPAGTETPQAGVYSPLLAEAGPRRRLPGTEPDRNDPPSGPHRPPRRHRLLPPAAIERANRANTKAAAPKSRPTPPARPPLKLAPSTSPPAPARPRSTSPATPTSPAPTRAPRSQRRDHHPGGGGPLRPRHRRRPRRRSTSTPKPPRSPPNRTRFPTILDGIPLDVRSITLKLSRPDFTLNPTNCEESSFTGSATSVLGPSRRSPSASRSAAAPALPFAPRLSFSSQAATKRAGNPALTATLTAKPGRSQHRLAPRSPCPTPSSSTTPTSRTPAPAVQFAEGSAPGEKCPSGSMLGFANAETPLLEKPLEGPVYLRTAPGRQPPRHRRRPQRPDRHRPRRPRRHRPRSASHHLRSRPRRPRLQVHPRASTAATRASSQNSTNLCAATEHVNVQLDRPERQEHRSSTRCSRSAAPSAQSTASASHHKRAARSGFAGWGRGGDADDDHAPPWSSSPLASRPLLAAGLPGRSDGRRPSPDRRDLDHRGQRRLRHLSRRNQPRGLRHHLPLRIPHRRRLPGQPSRRRSFTGAAKAPTSATPPSAGSGTSFTTVTQSRQRPACRHPLPLPAHRHQRLRHRLRPRAHLHHPGIRRRPSPCSTTAAGSWSPRPKKTAARSRAPKVIHGGGVLQAAATGEGAITYSSASSFGGYEAQGAPPASQYISAPHRRHAGWVDREHHRPRPSRAPTATNPTASPTSSSRPTSPAA